MPSQPFQPPATNDVDDLKAVPATLGLVEALTYALRLLTREAPWILTVWISLVGAPLVTIAVLKTTRPSPFMGLWELLEVITITFADAATIGAVLVLAHRPDGTPARRVLNAIATGLRRAPRLVWEWSVTNFGALLSAIAFILPGLYVYSRFALIDPVTILERGTRDRAFDLAEGHLLLFSLVRLVSVSIGLIATFVPRILLVVAANNLGVSHDDIRFSGNLILLLTSHSSSMIVPLLPYAVWRIMTEQEATPDTEA